MWLILCSSSDASAQWAFQGLMQLGVTPLHLLTAESLASARTWEHRLGTQDTQLAITLANGVSIRSSQIRGVLNRLVAPSDFIARSATPDDRTYAQAEMQAFYLSWLHALPGTVINRPVPQGLSGAWMHTSEWTLRASRAGLRTCRYRQSARAHLASFSQDSHQRGTAHSVISLRGETYGAHLPENVIHACDRLANAANADMLGVELNSGAGDEWTFADATTLPDLRVGGAPLLQRLAKILVEGEDA